MHAKTIFQGLAVALFAFGLSGCATMTKGSHQDVIIASKPGDAQVSLDDKTIGHTPLKASMSRKTDHTVRLTHPGYLPYVATFHHKTRHSFGVRLLLNGAAGMTVNHMSGAEYSIKPDHLDAKMTPKPPVGPVPVASNAFSQAGHADSGTRSSGS
ncbi:MAG: PEGA domain-containing protein [Salinisphaera sp.]|uniref:PEGA domain-containing protein n=1 Tax=Salinisphaera sp. TaxID=1914330 RepID=UPI003C7C47C1